MAARSLGVTKWLPSPPVYRGRNLLGPTGDDRRKSSRPRMSETTGARASGNRRVCGIGVMRLSFRKIAVDFGLEGVVDLAGGAAEPDPVAAAGRVVQAETRSEEGRVGTGG